MRARGGYVATPSIEQITRRDYEAPAVAALGRSPSPSAFPFQLRAISTPANGRPGLTSLVAAVDAGVVTFRENPAQRTYDGEVTVLARVTSSAGDTLATQSQLYQMHGDIEQLDAARQGRLLFFRTPEVAPGSHTVEWVVRDSASGDTSVLRSAMDVPLQPAARRRRPGDRGPRGEGGRRTTRRPHVIRWPGRACCCTQVSAFPSARAPAARSLFSCRCWWTRTNLRRPTSIELSSLGRSLGTIDVPTAKAEEDSLRQVGTLPIDKLPPGVYELKATITAGTRQVSKTATFTLVQ